MSDARGWAVQGSVEDANWVGFPVEEVLEGDPQAEVALICEEEQGEQMLYVGMFRAQPSRFRYDYLGDECVHVLEGHVTVTADSGESVDLLPGTMTVFRKGTRTIWHVRETVREFFVLTA